jgi:hypothetical protein
MWFLCLCVCSCEEFLATLDSEAALFPTNEDLDGVADALLRLQDTYALPASRIANGDLHPGLEDTAVMSGGFHVSELRYNGI